jgi:hypothetical protein
VPPRTHPHLSYDHSVGLRAPPRTHPHRSYGWVGLRVPPRTHPQTNGGDADAGACRVFAELLGPANTTIHPSVGGAWCAVSVAHQKVLEVRNHSQEVAAVRNNTRIMSI